MRLTCDLCGLSNSRVTRLVEDSSVLSPALRKRQWVPAGKCVCLSHRPYAFLPGKQDKAS